jgi:hypothetical protein
VVAIGLIVAGPEKTHAQARIVTPGVVAPNAHYDGLTYGEWLARLWEWTISVPAPENPTIFGNEADIGVGQPKHVWFIPQVVGNPPGPVVRSFTIPAGKALFVPIFTGEGDNSPCMGGAPTTFTAQELEGFIAPPLDAAVMQVEVDGVSVQDVAQYRFPTVFAMTYPEINATEVLEGCSIQPGTYAPAVTDGYALILEPLSVGEHTIHEHILIPLFGAVADNTFHITIAPQGH